MSIYSDNSRLIHPALRTMPPAFLPLVRDETEPREEILPFTVRLVSDAQGLEKAASMRHDAYARHLPEFAETLKQPEPADFAPGVVILLAESKLDGAPLGTMRIHSNRVHPLPLESSVELPASLRTQRLAEATRLAISKDRAGLVVKNMLFKAYFQYCQAQKIDWLVITGRAPIDRQYDRLMFADVYPELAYMPMRHVGNLPHRVMYFSVTTAETLWKAVQHPLYDFVFETHHSDLDLTQPVTHLHLH